MKIATTGVLFRNALRPAAGSMSLRRASASLRGRPSNAWPIQPTAPVSVSPVTTT
jgi:hypothetical protein